METTEMKTTTERKRKENREVERWHCRGRITTAVRIKHNVSEDKHDDSEDKIQWQWGQNTMTVRTKHRTVRTKHNNSEDEEQWQWVKNTTLRGVSTEKGKVPLYFSSSFKYCTIEANSRKETKHKARSCQTINYMVKVHAFHFVYKHNEKAWWNGMMKGHSWCMTMKRLQQWRRHHL